MDKFYKLDKDTTQYILFKENPEFNNLTCVQIAISEMMLEFMSHEVVQEALKDIWYGHIDSETKHFKVGLIWGFN